MRTVKVQTITVETFFIEQIEQCKQAGLLGTARNYERTLQSFHTFLQGCDIPLSSLDGRLVVEYESWLITRGVSRNSTSFYIRNLRSVYNKAVKRSLVEQSNPFVSVYTGIDKTRKRAVSEQVILDLMKLDLSYSPTLTLTRDLFVFSFCARGMSFVDIAFLKKTDVVNDDICYVRRKTGQQLAIHVEPCMAQIIQRYSDLQSQYVFPIITTADPELAYRQYEVALNYHNRKLKRLGKHLGISLTLSSYTARHTWATVARNHNVPLSVISECMGHSSEKTTQIYLASLEKSVLDKANKNVLSQLNQIN